MRDTSAFVSSDFRLPHNLGECGIAHRARRWLFRRAACVFPIGPSVYGFPNHSLFAFQFSFVCFREMDCFRLSGKTKQFKRRVFCCPNRFAPCKRHTLVKCVRADARLHYTPHVCESINCACAANQPSVCCITAANYKKGMGDS